MPLSLLARILILALILPPAALALVYPMPEPGSRLIGQKLYHKVDKGDYFQEIAERYNVGFLALMAANPGIDPFLPEPGTDLVIPSQMLLPFAKAKGIVINLPELRLYYYHPSGDKVSVFPIGIGRQGLATPRTISHISEKRKDPVWRPTAEMRQRHLAEHGEVLAAEVPPGPNNPFGGYALRLGRSEYLIHGTNQRFGIGMRASSGCIRMYDEDIKWLYENVAIDTPVRIVEQPVKMSYENSGQRLIELHTPLTDEEGNNPGIVITDVIRRFVGENEARWQELMPEIEQPSGTVLELKPL